MYIPEDTPPETLVLTVTTFDPDLGDNGVVTYLAPSLPSFLPLSPAGELTISGEGTLDRENQPVINISVVASDSG